MGLQQVAKDPATHCKGPSFRLQRFRLQVARDLAAVCKRTWLQIAKVPASGCKDAGCRLERIQLQVAKDLAAGCKGPSCKLQKVLAHGWACSMPSPSSAGIQLPRSSVEAEILPATCRVGEGRSWRSPFPLKSGTFPLSGSLIRSYIYTRVLTTPFPKHPGD